MIKFTKEQLTARIERQIDIAATIIERLGDDSSATSELAVETATMDIKILDFALAALKAGMEQEPVAWIVHAHGGDQLTTDGGYVANAEGMGGIHSTPLYAAPQLPQPAVVDADDNFYSWFGREWHENYQHNQYTTAAKQMLGVMAESAWRAGRSAAMLQGNHRDLSQPVDQQVAAYEKIMQQALPANSFTNAELEGMAHGDNPQSNAYRELLAYRVGETVLPDGYVAVPVEPTEDMVIAGFEAELREEFRDPEAWEAFEAMSGCQQAALRAKLCWAAMIKSAPKPDC